VRVRSRSALAHAIFYDQNDSTLTVLDLKFSSRGTASLPASSPAKTKEADGLLTEDGRANWTLVPVKEAGVSVSCWMTVGWMAGEENLEDRRWRTCLAAAKSLEDVRQCIFSTPSTDGPPQPEEDFRNPRRRRPLD
jgi:hypothetical protein